MAEEQLKKKRAVPLYKLPNNQILPLIALSTSIQLDKHQMISYFKKAFEYGYRHINCSRNNGNEAIVGQALAECIKEKRVKRQDLFINTKTFNHLNKNPVTELKNALKLMQLEYVDLYCLQFPAAAVDSQGQWTHRQVQDIWKDMELCIEKGYCKNIGVCNFSGQAICDLISYCKVKPICNQIQLHPYLSQASLVETCLRQGIQVFSLDSFCSRQNEQGPSLLKQQFLSQLSQKYNRTPSQLILKSLFNRDIGAVIENQKVDNLKQYYDSWNFELSEEDVKKIKAMNKNYRTLRFEQFYKGQFDIFE